MSTFILIAVYEFDDEDIMKSAEKLIKSGFKKFPLNKGQNGNIEQYHLEPSWNILKTFINNMPFHKQKWINPHVDRAVDNLLKISNIVPDPAPEIVEVEDESDESEDEEDDAVEEVEPWKIRFDSIIGEGQCNKRITQLSRTVIMKINNENTLNSTSLTTLCDDLTKKIKKYNTDNNKRTQIDRILTYIKLGE